MAYKDFTFDDLEERFGLVNRSRSLFPALSPIQPSSKLREALAEARQLPVRSEKSKSEMIVLPVLLELWRRNERFFTIYSGEQLNAASKQGLKGECDFILAKDVGAVAVNYPIMQLVEAKKHDIDAGLPQCAAQMLGAKIFNQKKKTGVEVIHGCVTTGDEWVFMRLEQELVVDARKYYLSELETVLAVFQHILDFYKAQFSPKDKNNKNNGSAS